MKRVAPFRTFDALRGFAALWVVMDHSCDRFLAGTNFHFIHQPLYAFAINGQLGVLIFFVVSGYCITAAAQGALVSGKSVGRYFYERGRRIFPPYWIALIVGVAAKLLLGFAEAHHWVGKVNHPQVVEQSAGYWFANLTLAQYELHESFANTVFWSLCYEVAFYAIVGVCLLIARRFAVARGMAAGQLALILSLAFSTFGTLLYLIIFSRPTFPFDLWHQFALGGLLFYLLESNPETIVGYSPRLRNMLYAVAGVTLALCVFYIAFRNVGVVERGAAGSQLRTTLCLAFCALLAIIKPFDAKIVASPLIKPFLWLGGFSYSLYLFHNIILPFVDVAARKAGFDGGRYWVAFLVQIAIAIPFGRLAYHVVERHFISSKQVTRLAEEHVL